MSILKTLKKILIPGSVFAEITEENLKIQRMKLGKTEYKKWLKKKWAELEAIKIIQVEKGLNIPESWLEKISMFEKEIREAEGF